MREGPTDGIPETVPLRCSRGSSSITLREHGLENPDCGCASNHGCGDVPSGDRGVRGQHSEWGAARSAMLWLSGRSDLGA
jgi:hypothetical protein